MRWFRRGILIRLAIYVPLIAFLAWRSTGGCDASPPPEPDQGLRRDLEPYRKVITLPDGTQQEIVELTAEEAEAILGHPIPRDFHDEAEPGEAEPGEAEPGDAKLGKARSDAKAGVKADAKADARPEINAGDGHANPSD